MEQAYILLTYLGLHHSIVKPLHGGYCLRIELFWHKQMVVLDAVSRRGSCKTFSG
jgi:hypothetical protein